MKPSEAPVSSTAGRCAAVLASAVATALAAALMAACASAPPAREPPVPFPFDAQFAGAQAVAADEADPFAMSPAMQAYAAERLRQPHATGLSGPADVRQALLEALYHSQHLRLHYDDSQTRTAAQAFDRRAGNCLSLVLLTAAFAKHLGLPVSYQVLDVEPTHARKGGLYLSSNHVNVVLQRPPAAQRRTIRAEDADLVVDFLPGREMAGARATAINEATLLAMFHNNRAAELLSTGQRDAAYWQARAAVAQDPAFAPALNTLGVVYQRAGLASAAEASYRQVLAREAHNKAALSNLVSTLKQQGRETEAEPVERLLARLQPQPPFQAFDEGRRAMERQDFARARVLFDLELEQQPYQAEVHLWAARAHAQLGNSRQAAHHLAQARDFSSTPDERDRYSAKLESLRHQTR